MKKKEYICSYQFALGTIVGRWKGLVLWHLNNSEKLDFDSIKELLGDEATYEMVKETLDELECNGVVQKSALEYSLTKHGITLVPILEQLHSWGDKAFEDYIKE
jgi:DNA-binding HxlR family transcriptional regulator